MVLMMFSHCACAGEIGRHALVSLRPGKLALAGDLEHRIPVDRRIILRRRRGIRRRHRRQIEHLARRRLHLRRIDEPVAAHPDVVIRLRQIGHHVAALIVGDDDLGEFGGQVGRFRDHPDAGFRSLGAGDHAAEVGVADADRIGAAERSGEPGRPLRRPPRQRRRDSRAISSGGSCRCSCSDGAASGELRGLLRRPQIVNATRFTELPRGRGASLHPGMRRPSGRWTTLWRRSRRATLRALVSGRCADFRRTRNAPTIRASCSRRIGTGGPP